MGKITSMFSSRFPCNFEPNRLTRLLQEKRREGARIFDLTESNPTRAGFSYPPEVVNAFADPRLLRYDPAAAGMLEAREAVARYYAARNARVEPERILLTASTSEGYAYLFKLLANPGDHILVPRPSYPLFELLATMESVEVRTYSLAYHGCWTVDFDSVSSAITDRTRAVILVNPNNPTGSYLKRAEMERLTTLCAERQIALISDEVFSDYSFGSDPERISSLVETQNCLAFSMSGLSKVAGLPQMKLGWIVASGPADSRTAALERLEWIADTYLSVGTSVQYAARRLLDAGEAVQRQIRKRTSANLQFALHAFDQTAATLLTVEGGWYLTAQLPRIRSEEDWASALLDRHSVLTQPGFFYDFETEPFLVLSLLAPPEDFREGIHRLVHFITAAE